MQMGILTSGPIYSWSFVGLSIQDNWRFRSTRLSMGFPPWQDCTQDQPHTGTSDMIIIHPLFCLTFSETCSIRQMAISIAKSLNILLIPSILVLLSRLLHLHSNTTFTSTILWLYSTLPQLSLLSVILKVNSIWDVSVGCACPCMWKHAHACESIPMHLKIRRSFYTQVMSLWVVVSIFFHTLYL